jgi:hypothetical protein
MPTMTDEPTVFRRDSGGSSVTPPYPEGNLKVATFRDPAGNVVGIWQQAAT